MRLVQRQQPSRFTLSRLLERKLNSYECGKCLISLAALLFLLVNTLLVLTGLSLIKSLDSVVENEPAHHHHHHLPAESQLTHELVATAMSHPLHGPSAVINNGTLCVFLSLLHAFTDEIFLDHTSSCSLTSLITSLGGADQVARVLPRRCAKSAYWERIRNTKTMPPPCPTFNKNVSLSKEFSRALRRMKMMGGEKTTPIEEHRQVAAAQLQNEHIDVGRGKINFHHFGYATPEVNVLDDAAQYKKRKLWDFMPLLPGAHPDQHGPYVFGDSADEPLYRAMLERASFAFTHRRGGWDTYRCLEILQAGAVPYFADLEIAPRWSVPHLPVRLLRSVLRLPGLEHVGFVTSNSSSSSCCFHHVGASPYINFNRVPTINRARFDSKNYWRIRAQLLEFTRRELTTTARAKQVLSRLSPSPSSNFRRLLIISGGAYEYSTIMLLIGIASSDDVGRVSFVGQPRLREMLVEDDAENTTISHHEKGLSAAGAYGAGFGFLRRIKRSVMSKIDFIPNHELFTRSRKGDLVAEHQAVIYTFVVPVFVGKDATRIVQKYPLLDDVLEHHPALPLGFVDGSDADVVPAASFRYLSDVIGTKINATFFVRELTGKHFSL